MNLIRSGSGKKLAITKEVQKNANRRYSEAKGYYSKRKVTIF